MPTLIPATSAAALRDSLAQYNGDVSADILRDLTDQIFAGLKSILNPVQEVREGQTQTVTVGQTPSSFNAGIDQFLSRFGGTEQLRATLNLPFKEKIAEEVARGGGRFVAQNDPGVVDEYPAWELYRLYDRKEPRIDHETRWERACADAGDSTAIAVFQSTGRMIALKSSDVWQSLGDGAGGYDDALGNPFPPFWFNSGMEVDGVPYNECVSIGLIGADDDVKPAAFNLGDLFAEIAA